MSFPLTSSNFGASVIHLSYVFRCFLSVMLYFFCVFFAFMNYFGSNTYNPLEHSLREINDRCRHACLKCRLTLTIHPSW